MTPSTDVRAGVVSLGVFDRFCDAWLACLRIVMASGHDIVDGSTGMREVLNVSMAGVTCSIDDFTQAGASADRIAVMIRKYHSIEIVPPYDRSYGALFRAHEGVDQVAWLVSRLRAKLETKSATIGFHVPGSPALSCVSLFDCKIRDGALRANVVYRSQNVFSSQPGNVIALSMIHQEIARRVGVDVGLLTLHVLSCHVYHHDFDDVERILGK